MVSPSRPSGIGGTISEISRREMALWISPRVAGSTSSAVLVAFAGEVPTIPADP
jgi:hypothetical protein